MIDDDDDRRKRRTIEETPAESPFSKRCRMLHCERLYHYLGSLELRLSVLEKSQVYVINRIEGVDEVDSIAAAERNHLQKSSKNLLDRWIEACRESCEDDRPSQSWGHQIVVNVEPQKDVSKPSAFPTFSKFRSIIILIGIVVAGVITGCAWFFDLLKTLKH